MSPSISENWKKIWNCNSKKYIWFFLGGGTFWSSPYYGSYPQFDHCILGTWGPHEKILVWDRPHFWQMWRLWGPPAMAFLLRSKDLSEPRSPDSPSYLSYAFVMEITARTTYCFRYGGFGMEVAASWGFDKNFCGRSGDCARITVFRTDAGVRRF